jgi:alanine racemase
MVKLEARRPTWTEINLDNLAFNFQSVKNFVGENIKYMAVVKADGYGHGAVECSIRLAAENVDWLAVALPEEGVELRKNGIKKPILCLGGFWIGQENLLFDYNLTPVIYQIEKAELFNRAAGIREKTANIHVKIDTGMGRIGVRFDEVREFADKLSGCKNLRVEGLMTHFAAADNLRENDFTNEQIRRFYDAVEIFESKGFSPVYKDLANSPGAVAHKNSRENMVRLGGVLYGLGGDVLPVEIEKPMLKPVLALYSRIAHLKRVKEGETIGYGRTFTCQTDSLIASVPIGYHDGLSRGLSNRGRVIINGVYAPIAGRISMDWAIIDVTKVPNVKLDDIVVVIGEQNGLLIKAEDLARLTDTISYEITCGVNRRVARKYVGSK